MVKDLSGKLWIIDFNARFPAWIFASSFSGYNLPGEFIEHAILSHMENLHVEEIKSKIVMTTNDMKLHNGTILSTRKRKAYYLLPDNREAIENARAAFTRSIIEIPRVNVIIDRTMQPIICPLSNHRTQSKGVRTDREYFIPTLPRMNILTSSEAITSPFSLEAITISNDYEGGTQISEFTEITTVELKASMSTRINSNSDHSNAIAKGLLLIEKDLVSLGAAALKFLQKGPTNTPKRVLCLESVQGKI